MMDGTGPKQPDGWERLVCHCGQARFAKVVSLRWRAGAGVTEEPTGYFCLECHSTVDSAAMIQQAHLRAKKRELRELESELADTVPPLPKMAKKGA